MEKTLIDQFQNELSNDGFSLISNPLELVTSLQFVAQRIVQLANLFQTTLSSEGDFCNLTVLRENLASGLSQNNTVTHTIVEHIVDTAHESIQEISKDIVPKLAGLAGKLGIETDSHRAIARFRIAAQSQLDFDHLWHQDSIDQACAARDERTAKLALWIPLHDVGKNEGTIEIAPGSHIRPIAHTHTDARGRLCFPAERVQTYDKQKLTISFGSIVALDPWIAHRTVPNTSSKIRIALLVWF